MFLIFFHLNAKTNLLMPSFISHTKASVHTQKKFFYIPQTHPYSCLLQLHLKATATAACCFKTIYFLRSASLFRISQFSSHSVYIQSVYSIHKKKINEIFILYIIFPCCLRGKNLLPKIIKATIEFSSIQLWISESPIYKWNSEWCLQSHTSICLVIVCRMRPTAEKNDVSFLSFPYFTSHSLRSGLINLIFIVDAFIFRMAFSRHENYSHQKKAVNSFLPSTLFFTFFLQYLREREEKFIYRIAI